MLPRNVRHYFVISSNNTHMYGYTRDGQLMMIFNLPWLRPYLFCSQIAAQKIAKKNHGYISEWLGKLYENSPDNNDMSS